MERIEPNEEKAVLDSALRTCGALLRLSRSLAEMIATDNLAGLEAALEERQRLIAALDLSCLAGLPEPETDDEAGARLLGMVRELQQADAANEAMLARWLDSTRGRMAEASLARQALHKYSYLQPDTAGLFLDRRQ